MTCNYTNKLPGEAIEGVVADLLAFFVEFELLMQVLPSVWEWAK